MARVRVVRFLIAVMGMAAVVAGCTQQPVAYMAIRREPRRIPPPGSIMSSTAPVDLTPPSVAAPSPALSPPPGPPPSPAYVAAPVAAAPAGAAPAYTMAPSPAAAADRYAANGRRACAGSGRQAGACCFGSPRGSSRSRHGACAGGGCCGCAGRETGACCFGNPCASAGTRSPRLQRRQGRWLTHQSSHRLTTRSIPATGFASSCSVRKD